MKYANATRDSLGGYEITGEGEVIVDDCFLSVDTFSDPEMGGIVVSDTVTGIKWHADLPCFRITTSENHFPEKIIEFKGKIPNVINGSSLFEGCSGLTSWSVELPNSLTNASWMFSYCTGLTSFSTPSGTLPNSITTAEHMFYDCTGLTEWTVALPNSLKYASGMFYGCSGLTSFQSNMPASLTTDASSMFSGCKLDITSVERISRTIANCTGISDYYKTIHLGVSSECHGDTNYNEYINRMKGKGWIVVCTVNGSSHTH